MRMTLALHQELFCIHSLERQAAIPSQVFEQAIYFISKTKEELSIVVPSTLKFDSLESEDNWRCLEVLGPLGFSMTGIMARISTTLAQADISIFAISTFDTDYILVKNDKINAAINALKSQSYMVINYQQGLA